jgi:uncharacterized paraquat-inducible protein A
MKINDCHSGRSSDTKIICDNCGLIFKKPNLRGSTPRYCIKCKELIKRIHIKKYNDKRLAYRFNKQVRENDT